MSNEAVTTPSGTGTLEMDAAERRKKGLIALRAATFGFFVDMYDIYLPIIALAPAIAYFTPDSLSSTGKSTLFYSIFAASLLGRPIGALIFGPLGDRIGRRKVTIISAAGFTTCTGLIAMLPGQQAWGMAPIILLGMVAGWRYSSSGGTESCP